MARNHTNSQGIVDFGRDLDSRSSDPLGMDSEPGTKKEAERASTPPQVLRASWPCLGACFQERRCFSERFRTNDEFSDFEVLRPEEIK